LLIYQRWPYSLLRLKLNVVTGLTLNPVEPQTLNFH